jgi:hypothetical protein
MYVLKLTLVPNREDRPRYVTLIRYEQRWLPVGDGTEMLVVVPLRRTLEWVRGEDAEGQYEQFMCTRVTELPFRCIKPQQAHRDLQVQWKAHLATFKKGPTGEPPRTIDVEVVP